MTTKTDQFTELVQAHLQELERRQEAAPTPERERSIVKIKQWIAAPYNGGNWMFDVPPAELARYIEAEKTDQAQEILEYLTLLETFTELVRSSREQRERRKK